MRDLTRREFLEKSLKTGSAFGVGILASGAQRPAMGGDAMQATEIPSETTIKLTVNGAPQAITVDVRTSLLDLLRERLHLTGTKKGCDHGQCGACTVHVNGRRVNSCLSLAVMHDGEEITTIEGLGTPDDIASHASGIRCARRIPVRLLHVRPDHVGALRCSRNPAVLTTRP